jgi:F-type H+-transporting ATPase subunit b
VLHRLLYRPLREAIDRRRAAHEQAQAEAEKACDEARLLEEQLQTQIADLDRQRQETLRQAHEQALAERQRLLDDASQAVQQRHEAARTALAREREETLKALHTEIIDQAVDLSRRLLSEAADLKLEQQLTNRLVETLQQCPENDRDDLRRTWNPQDVAVLETAGDLHGGAVEQVSSAVAALLGQPVSLTVERQASLVSGARLRLGGRVWDSSVAGQLDGVRDVPVQGPEHA